MEEEEAALFYLSVRSSVYSASCGGPACLQTQAQTHTHTRTRSSAESTEQCHLLLGVCVCAQGLCPMTKRPQSAQAMLLLSNAKT
eukprot:COSAG06_NODE_6467_length_2922_cov_13.045342_3_plen_85_part_00